MEIIGYHIADRKLWHKKLHFNIMCGAVHACVCTILYYIMDDI